MTTYSYANALSVLKAYRMRSDEDVHEGFNDVKEHLRRVALWTVALQLPDAKDPFLDLPAELGFDYLACASDLKAVESHLYEARVGGLMRRLGQSSLGWAWLTTTSPATIEQFGLPNPYEPILRCFQRGNGLFSHHGFIACGVGMFPIGTVYARFITDARAGVQS